jgi:hypothetical protein
MKIDLCPTENFGFGVLDRFCKIAFEKSPDIPNFPMIYESRTNASIGIAFAEALNYEVSKISDGRIKTSFKRKIVKHAQTYHLPSELDQLGNL